MRHLLMLSVITLVAIILVVGCGGSGSQGEQDHHSPNNGGSAELDLRPEGDSGVSGTASFEDSSDGVVVKLDLRGLPKPRTIYLAHIRPGTCAGEVETGHVPEHGEHAGEGEGHEQEGCGNEPGEKEEITYALSQVESDSEGHGSSTTAFGQTSVDKLFSGEPKMHVDVREAGSGSPPILTCADLERAG